MAEKGAGFDFTDAPFASASAQKAKGDEAKQDRAPPLRGSRAQHHLKTKEEGRLKKTDQGGRKEGPMDQRRYFLLFVYCSGLPGHPTTSLVEPPN
jgi:hypothetical protein